MRPPVLDAIRQAVVAAGVIALIVYGGGSALELIPQMFA
jgi:hypothetical protein